MYEFPKDVYEELVKSAVPRVLSMLGSVGLHIYEEAKLKKKANKFVSRTIYDCGTMQILGMAKPVPLEDIYTEVRITNSMPSRLFNSVKEIEADLRNRFDVDAKAKKESEIIRKLENIERNKNVQVSIAALKLQYPSEIINAKKSKSFEKESDRELFRKYKEQEQALIQNKNKTSLSKAQHRKIMQELPQKVEAYIREQARKKYNEQIYGHDFTEGDRDGTATGTEIISKHDKMTVLGKPGSGKTTLLKHLALKTLQSQEGAIPVYISLRDYSAQGATTIQDYVSTLFTCDNDVISAEFTANFIRKARRLVFLFDGLDEIPTEESKRLVNEIDKLARRNPQHKYVLTCRTANYRYKVPRFHEVEICDFSLAQVKIFAKNWFVEDNSLALSFVEEVIGNDGLIDLTSTPLLLALVCIGYRRKLSFSHQKALVYLACLDALLLDWDTSRSIQRESFAPRLDSETKKQILAKVACDTYCNSEYVFTSNNIERTIESAVKGVDDAAEYNGKSLLLEFERRHGLLVQCALKIYSFSHLTLQEFLTAYNISLNANNTVLAQLSDELLSDIRWKEVVVFLAGLMPLADNLFINLRNVIKSHMAVNHALVVFDVLNCDETETPSAISDELHIFHKWRMLEHLINLWSRIENNNKDGSINIVPNKILFRALRIPYHVAYTETGVLRKKVTEALQTSLAKVDHNLQLESNTLLEVVIQYLRFVGTIIDAIGSGSRITEQLRSKLMHDIISPESDPWEYVERPGNKFGI